MAVGLRRDADLGRTSPATLTIDLGALAANWHLLRDQAAPAECAGVVKADAYGLGIEPVMRALWRAGCRTFFVAHPGEAHLALAAQPDAVVYVLNGLLPGATSEYRTSAMRPVLGSVEEIRDWAAFCAGAGRRLPAALHVDTGMNRLGLSRAELSALAAADLLARFEPTLLMSHLVSAEDPADPVTTRQVAVFSEFGTALPGIPASLCNSSGLFLGAPPVHALVRPGYALYGGNPTPGRPNPMRPVVRLEAGIVQVREIGPGERVGYNGRWTAPTYRRVATLSVGYADGYLRAAGGPDGAVCRGAALVGAVLCPVLGTVSMDLLVIDVTDAPHELAKRGGVATLIGDELDVDAVGRRAGTIGYEILTALGSRYERRYVDG